MNRIKSSQLLTILLLSGAWSVLCMTRAASGADLLGILPGTLMQLAVCVPMLLPERYQCSMFRIVSESRSLGAVYVLFFLLWGAHGFAQFWAVSAEINLAVQGRMTAAVLITLVCLYTCSLGLRSMARCAPIVTAVLLLSVLVLLLGAKGRIRPDRLVTGTEGLLSAALSYFSMGGELAAAWILLGTVQTGKRRAVLGLLAGKAVLAFLTVFLCITVGGRLTALSEHPFFTLITLTQPLQSQRADALFILVFVMLYVMHITLQTGVIAHLLHAMFPKLRFAAPLSLGVMLLLSPWMAHASGHVLYSILILLTAGILPLWLCLKRRKPHESHPQTAVPDPAACPADDGMQHREHQ